MEVIVGAVEADLEVALVVEQLLLVGPWVLEGELVVSLFHARLLLEFRELPLEVGQFLAKRFPKRLKKDRLELR